MFNDRARYARIVNMVEESEQLKSAITHNTSNLAESLVPYPLAGTVLTYLIANNAIRNSSTFLWISLAP